MLIAFVMLGLWVIGLVTGHLIGGLLHVLLFLALVIILFRIVKSRRVAVHSEGSPGRPTKESK
jgi:hypothetical protein